MVRRFVRPPAKVRVRFPSDADVIGALRDDVPALAELRAAAQSGDRQRVRRLLVRHFRERTEPRFFVVRADVRLLAERLASEHPEWRDELLRSASDWQSYIYAAGEVPAGGANLPDWNALPLGPGKDTVYLHKAHHFLFAVQLARAQAYGADTRAILKKLIDSWVVATDGHTDPPAYMSPLVAVHRSVALTWAWAFLAGCDEPDPDLELAILGIILADARFVHGRLGTSVPNNHLLADGFLMFYLGMLYPEFREAARWRREGEALFLEELRRQIYEDGTSFEHSVHYHEFVCEMTTALVLLARKNGVTLEPWVEQRHRKMLAFQAALGGREAQSIAIGDSVEAHLFALDGFDGAGAASHRVILRELYDRGVAPPANAAPGQERAAWLLGGYPADAGPPWHDSGPCEFPDGGYVVLPDSALEGCLLLRSGPAPGRESNPGHMHADLLSVYLRLGGVPVIVDGGTYTYRSSKERWPPGEPEWRAHFLGPAAHNALCIDGRDPLDRGGGDFPSGRLKAEVQMRPLVTGGSISWTEAAVVGNSPYAGHVRGVVHVEGEYWLVYDLVPPAALTENAWLSLNFSHEASVRMRGEQSLVAEAEGAQLLVATSQPHRAMDLIKASRTPLGGWVSPRYGELAPAAVCRIRTTAGSRFDATLLQPNSAVGASPLLEVEEADSGAVGVRITRASQVDCVLLSRHAPGRRARLFDVEFEGTALWLRQEGERPVEVRALSGRKVNSRLLGFSVESRRGLQDFHVAFDELKCSAPERDETDLEIVLR
ncbi:MAG: alginate lyase family protein [Burkholderiales bacterium]|nr:alginate lyase family protein [Burkholderiales bacterium]